MKIFCIGCNKTGTTSLYDEFKRHGYSMGNQNEAEYLLNDYVTGNFDKIIKYCESADVFQDVPFSFQNTYRYLDEAYPNSKFILSVRTSADEWYDSLVYFHLYRHNRGKIPSVVELQTNPYRYSGWMWEVMNGVYGTTEKDPYDKKILTNYYNKHNMDTMEYFKDRPNDFLKINLSDTDSYSRFKEFIGIDNEFHSFPHSNYKL
jgi:hypothetical protein